MSVLNAGNGKAYWICASELQPRVGEIGSSRWSRKKLGTKLVT